METTRDDMEIEVTRLRDELEALKREVETLREQIRSVGRELDPNRAA